ncbi:unnamed protein product [Prorocentrum cordatum]|uniref:Uncharacterized protein n=1 Tax=Prorocentrum cordatum TaxID=2364126 RepID=A0ABN9TEC9_9DINO|nr:unnamed protein product [Polarella glacialis]
MAARGERAVEALSLRAQGEKGVYQQGQGADEENEPLGGDAREEGESTDVATETKRSQLTHIGVQKNPGHPGGKRGVSRHGLTVYAVGGPRGLLGSALGPKRWPLSREAAQEAPPGEGGSQRRPFKSARPLRTMVARLVPPALRPAATKRLKMRRGKMCRAIGRRTRLYK